MSRTTANIMRINKQLERISGLDGIVADLLEAKAIEIEAMVEKILNENSEASIFNYTGNE